MKQCIICKKKFIGRDSRQICCSKECSSANRKSLRNRKSHDMTAYRKLELKNQIRKGCEALKFYDRHGYFPWEETQ
jgi:hypothetical protein